MYVKVTCRAGRAKHKFTKVPFTFDPTSAYCPLESPFQFSSLMVLLKKLKVLHNITSFHANYVKEDTCERCAEIWDNLKLSNGPAPKLQDYSKIALISKEIIFSSSFSNKLPNWRKSSHLTFSHVTCVIINQDHVQINLFATWKESFILLVEPYVGLNVLLFKERFVKERVEHFYKPAVDLNIFFAFFSRPLILLSLPLLK